MYDVDTVKYIIGAKDKLRGLYNTRQETDGHFTISISFPTPLSPTIVVMGSEGGREECAATLCGAISLDSSPRHPPPLHCAATGPLLVYEVQEIKYIAIIANQS